jgi:hypothetical protein
MAAKARGTYLVRCATYVAAWGASRHPLNRVPPRQKRNRRRSRERVLIERWWVARSLYPPYGLAGYKGFVPAEGLGGYPPRVQAVLR